MLADVPNLFFVIGLPVASMAVAIFLCIAIFKVLGSSILRD